MVWDPWALCCGFISLLSIPKGLVSPFVSWCQTSCYFCSIFSMSYFNINFCPVSSQRESRSERAFLMWMWMCMGFHWWLPPRPCCYGITEVKGKGEGKKERTGSSINYSHEEGLSLPCPFAFLTSAPIKIPLSLYGTLVTEWWFTQTELNCYKKSRRPHPGSGAL